MTSSTVSPCLREEQLQASFQRILPRIQLHAQIRCRDIKCPDRRADLINEACALAWKWYVRLKRRGKNPDAFPMALANFAVRAARSGRRVAGQDKAKDVLSPRAQQRHGFTVNSLPSCTAVAHEHLYGSVDGQRKLDEFEERLQDNTQTPPPDQAAFRIDYPAWLQTWDGRHRRIIKAMSRDERTKDLSRRFGLSPGRISQLRRQYHCDWQRFLGDAGS